MKLIRRVVLGSLLFFSLFFPAAAAAPPAETVANALSIAGSLCAGDDCIANESFDTDTLRLKESVLRLEFQDTSTGAYPTRDWRITVNDAAAGGDDYFAIDSVDNGQRPFTISYGAPSNALTIAENGNVGIGIAPSTRPIHAYHDTLDFIAKFESGDAKAGISVADDTATAAMWTQNGYLRFNADGSTATDMKLDDVGNLEIQGLLSELSDINSKTNIVPVDNADVLQKLMVTPLSTWQYTDEMTPTTHMGPMAQDFYSIYGLGKEGYIAPSDKIGVALAALQEIHRRNVALEARVADLEARIAALEGK